MVCLSTASALFPCKDAPPPYKRPPPDGVPTSHPFAQVVLCPYGLWEQAMSGEALTRMLTREISRCEVSYHDSPDDCWLIIRNVVYDVTPFLIDHPGSMEVLIEFAGCDATDAFENVGHSMMARAMCDELRVGVLPAHEQTSYGVECITEAKKLMCPFHIKA